MLGDYWFSWFSHTIAYVDQPTKYFNKSAKCAKPADNNKGIVGAKTTTAIQ